MVKTGLHEAAMDATIDFEGGLVALARDHPEWAAEKDDGGRFPIHYAAACGRDDVVALLGPMTPGGAEARADDGRTPLHVAARYGRASIVNLLCEYSPQGPTLKDNVRAC